MDDSAAPLDVLYIPANSKGSSDDTSEQNNSNDDDDDDIHRENKKKTQEFSSYPEKRIIT